MSEPSPPIPEEAQMGPPKPFADSPPPAKGPNCLLLSLLGCGTVLALIIVTAVVAVYFAHSFFKKMVEQYTETAPVTLPQVSTPPEQVKETVARWRTFLDTVKAGKAAAPLCLNQDEINAIIQHDPEWKDLAKHVYIYLKDDLIQAKVSLPLEQFKMKMLADRYFNGEATFDVHIRNGVLYVFIQDLAIGGKPLSGEIMQGIRAENLAKNINRDNPEFGALVQLLASVSVKDNHLIVVPRKTLPAATETKNAPSAGEQAGTDDGASRSVDKPVAVQPDSAGKGE